MIRRIARIAAVLTALVVPVGCVTDAGDQSTRRQEIGAPGQDSVCDYALCTFDWQCASECSGPSVCWPSSCDHCGGRCVSLTAVPLLTDMIQGEQ